MKYFIENGCWKKSDSRFLFATNTSYFNAPNGITIAPIERRAAYVVSLFTTRADRSESGTGGFEMNNRFCS